MSQKPGIFSIVLALNFLRPPFAFYLYCCVQDLVQASVFKDENLGILFRTNLLFTLKS